MTVREDSIAAFYSDKLIIDSNGSIPCGQLYKGYQSYCEDSGLKPKSLNNFTPSLLELCNDSLGHSIAKKHGMKGKVVEGLRLRGDWEEIEGDTSHILQPSKVSPLSTNKNQNFSTESERSSYPSYPIQEASLEVVIEPSLAVIPVINESKAPKIDPDILTEF